MFKTTNSDIDFDALAQHVRHRAATGRRVRAVPPMPAQAEPVVQPTAEPAPPTWRDHVRRWPVVGRLLVYTLRGVRAARAPGLSPRERLRALPFVGAAGAWLAAVATLPRWRRHLHQQDARLAQELSALRASHAEQLAVLRATQVDLMRELAATRIALRAMQADTNAPARTPGAPTRVSS